MERKKIEKDKAAVKKRLWVRLSRVCNNNCIFCLDKGAQNGTFINFSEIEKKLKSGKKNKIDKVILSGGEATLHPDFFEIVVCAKKLGYKEVQIISNGRMFAYQKFLNKAVGSGVTEITFSLHGHNPLLHDKQTRVSGSFLQSLAGLRNALNKKGLIVNIDIVINKINVRFLPDIIKFFVHLGVGEFDLLQVMPFGSAWKNKDKLFYSIEENYKYLQEVFNMALQEKIYIWTNRFPVVYLEGFEDLIQHSIKLYDEVTGRKGIFEAFLFNNRPIDCQGSRCSYCFLEKFCGDLRELKDKNKLRSYDFPFCIGKASQNSVLEKKDVKDIFCFLDFFIKYRYFFKSRRCKECIYDRHCFGMQHDYIKQNGFSALRPAEETNLPYKIVRLGLACNLDCSFCNVPQDSFSYPELTTAKVKEEIKGLLQGQSRVRLDISGGEPTQRNDLATIVKYAVDLGAETIQIQTNGIALVDKKLTQKLVYSGVNKFFVALHSFDPVVHDLLVGKRGTFLKTVKGIRNVLRLGAEVILNPVITSKNYKNIFRYIEFVKNNFPQIKFISLSVVQPRGRAWENKKLIPCYKKISSHVSKALSLGEKYGVIINNPYCGLPFCIGGWYNYLDRCVEYIENKAKKIEADKNPDKIKAKQCFFCDLNQYCNGVWREYAQIYSLEDLRPLKKTENTYSYR